MDILQKNVLQMISLEIATYLQSTNYFASQNPRLHSIIVLILNWPLVCRKANLLLKAACLEVSPQL
jgi:hypothetical protein